MGTPSPVLTTARLRLTPIDDTDIEPLDALLALAAVRRYLLDGKRMEREWTAALVADSRRGFASRGLGLWAARRPRDPTLVGLVGFPEFFEPPVEELLYALHPDAWGAGLATEMARAAIDHAFDVAGRDRVRASTDVPNEASLAVMARLGLKEIGREPAPPGSKWGQIHCAIERAEWSCQRRRRAGD
jgi:RimJ/RimL family protein N-acetyltransferase